MLRPLFYIQPFGDKIIDKRRMNSVGIRGGDVKRYIGQWFQDI